MMKVIKTSIDGALLLQPQNYKDSRGFFFESYRKEKYFDIGIDIEFLQDNFSSSTKNVLRGLHLQMKQSQGKLVSVISGKVFDVAVDLRKDSSTFGNVQTVELDSETHNQFYIPPGCAHGFQVVSETAIFHYKCTDYYAPQYESGIIWNDPSLGIPWPSNSPIVSKKDSQLPTFQEFIEGI